MKKFTKKICALCCALLMLPLTALHGRAEQVAQSEIYDPAEEGIVSSYYSVDAEQGFIWGIAPGTTAQQLQNVCIPAKLSISQETLATGTVVTATSSSEEAAVHTLTTVVTGDLNGDGNVSITDMLMIKSKVLGNELERAAEKAGDINYDGNVSITDFLQIKATLLGKESITARTIPQTQQKNPLLMMTPDSTINWMPASAVSLLSDDETVATVADGAITAGSAEGSVFVYALDGDGRVIERVVVTILAQELTIALGAEEYQMLPGATQMVTAYFNHPVSPAVTWSTTDPAIVSVDEFGTMTAHAIGTVQLTATLPNGSSAQATVMSIQPITAVEADRDLYKVKPGHSRQLELVTTPSNVGEVFTWVSSDTSIATVDENGVVTGVNYGTTTITATGKYSHLSASCQVKVCDVKQIAITFDDGPSSYTVDLLDYLKEKDFKVTFFLVGDRLSSYPDTLTRQVNEGHEIGYHSFAHAQQTGLSSEQITADFKRAEAILKDITGAEFTVWRTPGGAYNTRVLEAVDVPHIMWTVDTLDWQNRNTNQVYNNIVKDVRDGSIVLLHDLYKTSVEGAKLAMDELWAGDYEFLTVTELLSRDGTPPEPSKNYFGG